MPHHPLPNQAVAPCHGVARELYRACWIKVAHTQAPWPPDTYQEGDACYIPVAANPKQPVGEPKHLCPENPRDALPDERSAPGVCRP